MTAFRIVAPPENSFTERIQIEDDASSLCFYELMPSQMIDSQYEMIPRSLLLTGRMIDGEWWASWGREHAAGESLIEAANALWEQLGHYLDSLNADEANLSPDLRDELQRLSSLIRRR